MGATTKKSSFTIRQIAVALGVSAVCPDKLFKRNGRFTVRWGFFYRHGLTAQQFANRVVSALEAAGRTVLNVRYKEVWQSWPKDSYFEVGFEVA